MKRFVMKVTPEFELPLKAGAGVFCEEKVRGFAGGLGDVQI